MKTARKILLGLFAVSQFLFVLFISIPTIPKKIQNETIGTQYSFDEISFNLARTDMSLPDEETLSKIQEETDSSLFMLISDDNQKLMIINSEKNSVFVEELLNKAQNPFKYGGLAIETQTLFWIFKGNEKTIVQSITIAEELILTLDMKLKDKYYTAVFTGDNWTDEDISEFMRSISLNH